VGIQATLQNRGLFRTRVSGRPARITAVVRIVAGVVFVLFGVVKFIVPEYELAEFIRVGFPNLVAIVSPACSLHPVFRSFSLPQLQQFQRCSQE